MGQRQLCQFIRQTVKDRPDEIVYVDQGRSLTLHQVFDSLNITAHDVNVDMLDLLDDEIKTAAPESALGLKYSTLEQNRLKNIFLFHINYVQGKYFADLLKQVMSVLEESKYQHAEMRLIFYAYGVNDWDNLARWALRHEVYSDHVRWLIEIPRRYHAYYKEGICDTFEDYLINIFLPLFEVTSDPSSHPELHMFLQYVAGIDSADDECNDALKPFAAETTTPQEWSDGQKPSYSYYLYYFYANLTILNQFREQRGFNVLRLRPNCGESGDIMHLVAGFLTSESIASGMSLSKSPVLQYLYYLAQIPISISPLSYNSIHLDYIKNPLNQFFAKGLFVTIATEQPLNYHFTREPLMEEYSIAEQMWHLSSADICELARNSVLMSGFSSEIKEYWLGADYMKSDVSGNNMGRSNVPDIRISFRHETRQEELQIIFRQYKCKQPGPITSQPDRKSGVSERKREFSKCKILVDEKIQDSDVISYVTCASGNKVYT